MSETYRKSEREKHRREDNRRFILQAAEIVFSRFGYSQATMDAIAAEAQFSKATIYKYFENKQDIFFHVILQSFDEAGSVYQAILNKPLNAEKKLREFVHFSLSFYKQKEKLIFQLFMDHKSLEKIFNLDVKDVAISPEAHPGLPAVLQKKISGFVDIQQKILEEGIASGEFRLCDVKNARSMLGALIRGFHFRGPLLPGKDTTEESVDIIIDFFLNGIRNSDSRQKEI
jgi:AcrR family transcriptional regulator